MPQVKVGDLYFEYDECGNKDDPAILLIMGLGEQLIFWHEDFCQELARHRFRVIRFDSRDVGLSSKLEGQRPPNMLFNIIMKKFFGYSVKTPYTISDMANDVIGIMDALGVDKCHIVGASMGALIAMKLGIHHSDRILSIAAIFPTTSNPKLKQPDKELLKIMANSPNEKAPFEEILKNKITYFEALSGTKYPLDSKMKETIADAIKRSYYPQGIQRQLAALIAEPAIKTKLRAMRTPILVIHGDQDKLVPLENGLEVANNAPNSELVIIKGMGHMINSALFDRLASLISKHAEKHG